MSNHSYEDDPDFSPDAIARDIADEIREYISDEADTSEEAMDTAGRIVRLLARYLSETDWDEVIDLAKQRRAMLGQQDSFKSGLPSAFSDAIDGLDLAALDDDEEDNEE